MFRSDERRSHAPGQGLILIGAMLALAVLIGMQGEALGQEAPAYKPPSAERAPGAGSVAPDAERHRGGGQGESPGASERDGYRQYEAPPGCPYRDRPLNLLV